jgi:hypothetical protein
MTSRRRGVLVVLALLLVAGCGLPLPSGVQVPGEVKPEDVRRNTLQVLPPGPNPAADADDVVRQFIGAQRNGEGRHAIARQFLAPEIRDSWDDTAGVQIYDEAKQEIQTAVDGAAAGTASVQVVGVSTARISADGSYDPRDEALIDSYKLRRDPVAGWLLTEVPPGLRLEPGGFALTFVPRQVYYLARGSGPTGHLAADPAFLPAAEDPATALVRRLLAGPSVTLQGAVDTAVPPGTELRSVTTDAAGLVTVDLGPAVATLPAADRERLSAQLVWTLRRAGAGFVQLRLLSDGSPVVVPGIDAGEPQPRDAWAQYDPEGVRDRVVSYYLQDRRLRTLDGEVPAAVTTPTGELSVDLAAVSPRTNQLAALTDLGEAGWEVRTGPIGGQLSDRVFRQPALRSPSWGSGRRGLWLVQGVQEPRVLLLDDARERLVPVDAPPGFGRLVSLRVSRDGTRVAMVAGDDVASRRVYVGTVEQSGDDVRITKVRALGPGVTEVADVAWQSGTSLVVLGRVPRLSPLPLRLSVDGSAAVDVVRLPGLEKRTPTSLAAAAGQPLLVAATEGKDRVVLRDEGGVLAALFEGYAPFYPG